MLDTQKQIALNKKKSYAAVVFFILFFTMIGFLTGKLMNNVLIWTSGTLISSSLICFLGMIYSDKIILSLSGAKEVKSDSEVRFKTTVYKISSMMKLPVPRLFIIEDNALNALSIGINPKYSAICLTRGLLSAVDDRELEGIISHEMAHIQYYDISYYVLISVLIGSFIFFSDWVLKSQTSQKREELRNGEMKIFMFVYTIIMAIIFPILATIFQLAVSRKREFFADAAGVLVTRDPLGLSNALEKISSDNKQLLNASYAIAHLFIVNPFIGQSMNNRFANIFNTHPAIKERIQLLKNM